MSELHLKTFRILVGIYLLIHFLGLIPYAGELFSDAGIFADPRLLPSYGFFPNPLFSFASEFFAQVFLVALVLLSALLVSGVRTRIVAAVIWFGWAALLSRAPFIANPSIPFIGLLLLGLAALPADWSSMRAKSASLLLWRGIWVLLAISYTVSGIHKLGSPSWVDGSALAELTQNPLARDYFVTKFLGSAPSWITSLMTWGSLALEILFAPLALFALIRPWVWLAMVGMQIGILGVISFADLTAGMLLVHLFVFDGRWIPARRSETAETAYSKHKARAAAEIVFFDGSCVMCNQSARMLMAVDYAGVLKFATLNSASLDAALPLEKRKQLPDSILVKLTDGTMLARSDAILAIGATLGGGLGLSAMFLRLMPRRVRDSVYDLIAKSRYRMFGRTAESCGLIPKEQRSRILP